MTKDEALKLALVALENAVRYHNIMLMADPPQDAWKYHKVEDNAKQAITAIKKALAQPPLPVQEPVGEVTEVSDNGFKCEFNRRLAVGTKLYIAPPLLEQEPVVCRFCHSKKGCWTWQCYNCGEIDDVQKPTPPATKPEQEPSAWRDMIVASLVREGINKHKARELADHFAAQRPWQGMTEQDMPSGENPMFDHQFFCAGMVYAAKILKAKNT